MPAAIAAKSQNSSKARSAASGPAVNASTIWPDKAGNKSSHAVDAIIKITTAANFNGWLDQCRQR